MRKCIIFGHSHIYAPMWAAALSESIAQRQKDVTFEFLPIASTRWTYPLIRFVEGRAAPNDYVMQLLLLAGGLDQDSCLFSIFGGNDHNILGLLHEDPPFEVVDPERPGPTLQSGTRIVPYRQLQNYFYERMRNEFDFLNALKQETKNTILQLETPPPIPSTEHIKLHLDPYFKNKTNEPIISSAAIRMKLWSCMTSVVRNNCKKLDIAYLSVPEDALDTEGFLLEKAWSDSTHTSVWYGEKYLEKIYRLVTAAP